MRQFEMFFFIPLYRLRLTFIPSIFFSFLFFSRKYINRYYLVQGGRNVSLPAGCAWDVCFLSYALPLFFRLMFPSFSPIFRSIPRVNRARYDCVPQPPPLSVDSGSAGREPKKKFAPRDKRRGSGHASPIMASSPRPASHLFPFWDGAAPFTALRRNQRRLRPLSPHFPRVLASNRKGTPSFSEPIAIPCLPVINVSVHCYVPGVPHTSTQKKRIYRRGMGAERKTCIHFFFQLLHTLL